MTRLIDADALKESIDEHVYLVNHGFNETEYGCTQYGIHQIIDEAPTIDAEPVRHGKFIGTEYDGYADGNPVYYEWKCSECGCIFEEEPTYRYCPNCGARMDKYD